MSNIFQTLSEESKQKMNDMGLLCMVNKDNRLEIVFQNRIGLDIQYLPSIDTYNISLNTFDARNRKTELSRLFIESPIPFTKTEQIPLENVKGKEFESRIKDLLSAIQSEEKQLLYTGEFEKIYALRMLEVPEDELNQMGIAKSDLTDTIVREYRSDGYDEATGMYDVTEQIPRYLDYLSDCEKNTDDIQQKTRYAYIKDLLEECVDIIADIQNSMMSYYQDQSDHLALEV